jgi:hypothetical protein
VLFNFALIFNFIYVLRAIPIPIFLYILLYIIYYMPYIILCALLFLNFYFQLLIFNPIHFMCALPIYISSASLNLSLFFSVFFLLYIIILLFYSHFVCFSLFSSSFFAAYLLLPIHIRGVLGNKCAEQHNLKTVHFRETLVSGNFLACSSAICVFICSPLSIPGPQGQAFM